VIPDVAGHLLTASVLAAPAAILVSELMVPEKRDRQTAAPDANPDQLARSAMDAIVKGAAIGLELLLNICAMMIVLIALVHLVNAMLGLLPDIGSAPVTLERLLAYIMAPVCWLMGIPWAQATEAGALMGIKTVLNEFVAYFRLAALPADALDPRSRLIMTYALCGFANFGSLGIMIAGLTVMAPGRRDEIVSLGWKSIVSGTLTTCLIGAIVGILS
jgi:CNT family concentrative nucleoside transporter